MSIISLHSYSVDTWVGSGQAGTSVVSVSSSCQQRDYPTTQVWKYSPGLVIFSLFSIQCMLQKQDLQRTPFIWKFAFTRASLTIVGCESVSWDLWVLIGVSPSSVTVTAAKLSSCGPETDCFLVSASTASPGKSWCTKWRMTCHSTSLNCIKCATAAVTSKQIRPFVSPPSARTFSSVLKPSERRWWLH